MNYSQYKNISMNNGINMFRKMMRDNLERRVLNEVNKQIPNVEQYIASHRYPTLPKIVVYSAAAQANSFLEKIFPFYSLINPSVGSESDEVLTRKIAEQLTREEEGEQSTRFGYLIKGFPFNTNQALLLDRYLNGVNLALHLRSKDESSDYTSSIESLLGYYEHRGTLLQLQLGESEPTAEQSLQIMDEIRIKIKRN